MWCPRIGATLAVVLAAARIVELVRGTAAIRRSDGARPWIVISSRCSGFVGMFAADGAAGADRRRHGNRRRFGLRGGCGLRAGTQPAGQRAAVGADRLQSQHHPDVHPDGRVRDAGRHEPGAVHGRQRLGRASHRRPGARNHPGLRRVCGHQRLVGRHGRHHEPGGAAGDAPLGLRPRASQRA